MKVRAIAEDNMTARSSTVNLSTVAFYTNPINNFTHFYRIQVYLYLFTPGWPICPPQHTWPPPPHPIKFFGVADVLKYRVADVRKYGLMSQNMRRQMSGWKLSHNQLITGAQLLWYGCWCVQCTLVWRVINMVLLSKATSRQKSFTTA